MSRVVFTCKRLYTSPLTRLCLVFYGVGSLAFMLEVSDADFHFDTKLHSSQLQRATRGTNEPC